VSQSGSPANLLERRLIDPMLGLRFTEVPTLNPDIHPAYVDCRVTCSCGNMFETRATTSSIHVDVCSSCHPFYTGQQRLVDSTGQVERFERRRRRTRG